MSRSQAVLWERVHPAIFSASCQPLTSEARAARISQLWQRIAARPWPMAKLDGRGAVFSAWTKAERKRHFADLLESFDPMYPSLYFARSAQGQQVDALAPEALDAWANQEWVDPRR